MRADPAVARRLHRVTEAVVAFGGRCRERLHAPHEAQPAEDLGLLGDPRDRDRGPERGDTPRGRAALRRAHDRGDAEILGGLHRGVRDRPGDPVVVDAAAAAPCGVVRARGHASAASATSLIVRTVSAGYSPTAVSSESMSASVPSSTALATSFTSARVGSGERVIDSSICVAVMTGFPAMLQNRMISFWISGTRRAGTWMPRSPRATITASAAPTMPGRWSSATAVSIFATSMRPVPALGQARPYGFDVFGAAHERQADEVGLDRDRHLAAPRRRSR